MRRRDALLVLLGLHNRVTGQGAPSVSADSRVFRLARSARCATGVSIAKLSSIAHTTAAWPPCLVHVHTYVVLAVGRAHQPPQ